jgi:two-component system invasion response regulator UvrY
MVLGVAENSVQALASMRTGVWNLVILDLALPGDDGNVVLRRLRQQHPAVPVLIISMHPAD